MGWSRDELEKAYADYRETVVRATRTRDWNHYADQFTEDAKYVEHAYGTMNGREAIRKWVTRTMSSFPGSRMTSFPPSWYVIDEERGWVICEVQNPMEDPGDGTEHNAPNITILHYAGDGLWSYQEDAYNPMNFLSATKRWCAHAEKCGNLPDDARAWLDKMAKMGV
ncbi:nuclear transport factor 2 family protein [Rhodococcus artemisiae]|uniref:Nuclear transport factor 2 family protein n=1 Tax=Rhodococcus artemisiae TaxID=714159 RepID=A0ABU7LIH6_9NOCA|nr:nuclear transport factor 2 family protein [Rhodococcus artemisiae]MEE2061368.1 nuclear transport factor 2 family protein [Rhodococcus artemisiae]